MPFLQRIAIVDYCKGNLRSVERALTDAGFDAFITAEPERIAVADGIVLPGVGSFADAASTMEETGQMQAIRERVREGIPFLGICLGLQLALDFGEEGCEAGKQVEGLQLVGGHAERMAETDDDGKKYKIPHVGWNSVTYRTGDALFAGIAQDSYFYFTHSYCGVLDDRSDVTAMSVHAQPFAAAIQRDNVFATQFHPEKSSAVGLRLLTNFGLIVEEG